MALTVDRHVTLAEVARRYYIGEESQQEIADTLGTSRSNVSRLLDAARAAGVVQFIIHDPLQRHSALEEALRDRFGLADAQVVASPDASLQLVGRVGARWIEATDAGRLAIGWGRTVQAAIDAVAVGEPRDVEVVQIGGDLTVAPAASGHELVHRLASRLGGRHQFLHAPALVETERAARELLGDPRIATQLAAARTADAAMIGIGLPVNGFVEPAASDLSAAEPAAVVAARLLDRTGAEVQGPFRNRVVALGLDDLRSMPNVAGIAAGAQKGPAIAAALRAGIFNTLICDQTAAAAALET